MNNLVLPAKANRLAVGIARSRGIPYAAAEGILRGLSLRIVVEAGRCSRLADEAALLTAVNVAHRAFLGGVEVRLSENRAARLLHRPRTLWEALMSTGWTPATLERPTATLYLGQASPGAQPDDVIIHADSWRGGVSDVATPVGFLVGDTDDFALGGIFAGAAAVHRCFIRAVGLPARGLDRPNGISLWEPGGVWTKPLVGQRLFNLPTKFWLLGLGHLGQAYAWNLALLPHAHRPDVKFLLNDFDVIEDANRGSGLLSDAESVGAKKTRHCAGWLEREHYATQICERRFSGDTRRHEDEPSVTFCGFDRAEPRCHLESAGFGLVIECGLGASLADFDRAQFHIFPGCDRTAHQIWSRPAASSAQMDPKIAALFGGTEEGCGQLAIDVAGKSVSTSFVGAMAGALATAEMLRVFNRGTRHGQFSFNARCEEDWLASETPQRFTPSELGAMGCATLPRPD